MQTFTLYGIWRQNEGDDPVKVEEVMAPSAPEAVARYCEDEIPDGRWCAAMVRANGWSDVPVIDPVGEVRRYRLHAIPVPSHRAVAA